MSNERKVNRMPGACQQCEQWAEIHNPVRVYSLFTSILDKMEDRVMHEEFKPTTGDMLRVWDAVQTMDSENRSSEGRIVQWIEPEAVTN